MWTRLRGRVENSTLFQLIATHLCVFQSSLADLFAKGSNNKYVIGSLVIMLGSVYPLILKYTKNGQSKYPFMIGVAVCVKNIFMLIYYVARYLTWLYSAEKEHVYNYEHFPYHSDNDIDHADTHRLHSESSDEDTDNDDDAVDGEKDSTLNANMTAQSLHLSHHHFPIDNTSHQMSPQLLQRRQQHATYDIDDQSATHNVLSIIGATPSKIANALHLFKARQPDQDKAKSSSLSLHKYAQNESEIETLSKQQQLEMQSLSNHADIENNVGSDGRTMLTEVETDAQSMDSVNSKQRKLVSHEQWQRVTRRLKLYCYLAPNAILVLINDILALYTLSFVSVATYAVFMQVTILFIVLVRYFCLNKVIRKSQLLSVCISVFGMMVFELVELEPKIADESQSVLTDDDAKSDMIGIGLCMVRGVFKACDLVYVEWFIHHLNEIPFYEKQAVVSVWFVVCSFLYVVLYHGNDLFLNHRYVFDGFNDITWIFVGYGTFFALMIYLLILRLDSMVMGFCQQMTVLFAVALDVIIFHTKVTVAMWSAAVIVVIAIIQYSVIQYEQIKSDKQQKRLQLKLRKHIRYLRQIKPLLREHLDHDDEEDDSPLCATSPRGHD